MGANRLRTEFAPDHLRSYCAVSLFLDGCDHPVTSHVSPLGQIDHIAASPKGRTGPTRIAVARPGGKTRAPDCGRAASRGGDFTQTARRITQARANQPGPA